MAVNYKPFSTPNTPLSLLIDLCVPSCSIMRSVMMETYCSFSFEHLTSLTKGEWKLSNIWRNSPDFRCLCSATQTFFAATYFFFLFFFPRIEKHECCGGWTLQKANVFDLNVIFVTIEVYIFIRIFGLYSDPVTDCTFVGNVLSSSPQQNPHLPLWGPCWYLTPDFFLTFALRSRDSSMLASVHFSQVGRSVYFVT